MRHDLPSHHLVDAPGPDSASGKSKSRIMARTAAPCVLRRKIRETIPMSEEPMKSSPKKSASKQCKSELVDRITGRPLSPRDLKWIERQLPKASGPFARLLGLLLLLDAWKRR